MKILLSMLNTENKTICDLDENCIDFNKVAITTNNTDYMYLIGKKFSFSKYKSLGCVTGYPGYLFIVVNLDIIEESKIDYTIINNYIKSQISTCFNVVHDTKILNKIRKKFPFILFIGVTDIYLIEIYVHYNNKHIDGIIINPI